MSTYAISDLHGRLDLFLKLKEFLTPEDKCYVLGDCCDRGLDGWEIIKLIYNDPQFIYLKGNHEEMLANAILANERPYDYRTFENWSIDTHNDLLWGEKLKSLPAFMEYKSADGKKIYLSHAGFTPTTFIPPGSKLLWGSNHYFDFYAKKRHKTNKNIYVIHGHRPIILTDMAYNGMEPNYWEKIDYDDYGWEIYNNFDFRPMWYYKDIENTPHKCNIDAGAYWSGHLIVLNLDTFEYFLLNKD